MQYRRCPKFSRQELSILGFGCMRLPTTKDGHIDEEAATRLLHRGIEAGINYVDTAWPYHGGESEPFVGRALRGTWRDKVQLATKHPVWLVNDESDWERYLDQQLERLQTNHIDVYLLHALDGKRWDTIQRFRAIEAMERARADGRIGHIGFSFHGPLDDFKRIVDGYDWEICQIQLNYMDQHYQAGSDGLAYAAARNIGVVIMEPLRGGALSKAPATVERIWARSGRPWTPSGWALRWLWNQPGVTTVLSGMGAEDQLLDNLGTAGSAAPLTPVELALVDEARAYYQAKTRVPCTTCGYCRPCPSNVAISDVLSLLNSAAMFESKADPTFAYKAFFVDSGLGADQCTACRECESRCPQGIAIPDMLAQAHAELTG